MNQLTSAMDLNRKLLDAPNLEFLFLRELQHHIRRELEKRESPDLKGKWADYLAQCDLLKYLSERGESET